VAGGYLTVGVSEKKGVTGGFIFEAGNTLGPVETTAGLEIGAGTKSGPFITQTGFAQVGSDEFGVGMAWDLEHGIPFSEQRGEVSPFVYFPIEGVTIGVGIDISYDKSRF
jgi:hypothetical protein